ncbi:MAG: biopolymer transporter ExbD [Methylacidiphilales bacterium]|nr:biopolymer transporter ExbD [Candidatus Methylacidiphilales bacterium]
MKFTNKKPQTPRIDLTSLVDVVFMLLVFFVLTTTFEKQAGLSIQLPKAISSPLRSDLKKIYIQIDTKGKIYLDGRIVQPQATEALVKAMRQEMISDSGSYQIMIQADARAPHQSVVQTIAASNTLKVGAIGIVTIQP